MALDFKTVIESLLPGGSAWVAKSGGSLDGLIEGMATSYENLREGLAQLSRIRDPEETPILSDLEHEYGVIPDPALTTSERREVLKGIVYAKPGMGYDHLTAELHKAGFTNLFAYENNPLINPEFYSDGTWSAWCGGEDSFCGGEEAYCGYASGGEGYILINDNSSDSSKDVPEDDSTWHLVFFVGGVKSDALVGWFLLNDGDMEAVGTTSWTAGPDVDTTTLDKDAVLFYEGAQSLSIELNASATDKTNYYAPQDIGVDALDTDLKSAPLMHDAGSQVLYDSGFSLDFKERLNGENGDSGDVLGLGVASGGTNAADKLAIDFTEAQLARFEGDVSDEGTFSCWAKVNDASRAPTFDLDPGAATGYGDLPEDLTINGTTVSPTFRYEAQDADATSWDATVGDNLPAASSGTDPLFDALAPGPEDYRVKFEGGEVFQAAAGTSGVITTGDFAIEVVFQAGSTGYLCGKSTGAGSYWALYQAATGLRLLLSDGSGSVDYVFTSVALEVGKWYHSILFGDRSGSVSSYTHGAVGGTTSITGVSGSFDNASAKLTLGALSDLSAKSDSAIAFVSMWHSPAWLDSHLQEDIAVERAMIAMGLYPSVAAAGVSVDPTFKIPADTSGYAALDEDITINSVTKSPTFRYEADQATTSAWLATVGDDLAIAGSGADVVIDEYAPGLTDSRVDFKAAKYFQAASATYAKPGTDDLVFELIIRQSASVSYPVSKYINSSDRLAIIQIGNKLQVSANGVNAFTSITLDGQWNHILIFLDRSGSMSIYANGTVGAPADISSLSALDFGTAAKWTIGATSTGGSLFDGSVAYLAMWQGAGWLDTHLQADVAAERFAKASGIWPSIAAGTAIPTVASRSTLAYVTKLDSSDNRLVVPVGANWMRACEDIDESDDKLSGYLPETQATNIIPNSEGGGAWALVDAGDVATLAAATAPDGETTALSLVADTTDGNHGYLHAALTLTAATWTFSAWVNPGDVDHAKLECTTVANAYAYYNATTGTVGTIGAGCSRAKMYGPYANGEYRCEMTFTGTAAAHTVQILSSNADNDDTFAGDAATVNSYLWGMQLEAYSKATSRVVTSGASATRIKDQLRFVAGDNIGGEDVGQGIVECSVLAPDHTTSAALSIAAITDGGSGNERIYFYGQSSTIIELVKVGGATQAGIVGAGDVSSGSIAKCKAVYATNNFSVSFDDVVVGTDISGAVPDDLDTLDIGQDNTAAYQYNALISDFTVYPSAEENYDGYLPKTFGRASETLIEKVLPGDTETALIPVGSNWMRVDRVFDKDLAIVQGYNARPQSTNLFTYSEAADNAAWTKTNITSIDADAISALGEQDFDGIVGDATDAIHSIEQATAPPATGYYTLSAYVVEGDKSFAYMAISEVANAHCYYNLTSGAVSAGAGAEVVGMENKGLGVWRIWLQVSIVGAAATGIIAPADSISDNTFAGDTTTTNLYVFGMQIEESKVPTTYILTTSATATRTADILTMHGKANVGGEDPTTMYLRTEHFGTDYDGFRYVGEVVNINDSTIGNQIAIYANSDTMDGAVINSAGDTTISGGEDAFTGELQAYDYEVQLNKFKLFKDRTQLSSTSTSGTMAIDLIDLDIAQRYDSTQQLNGLLGRLTISPYGLSRPRGIMGSVKVSTGEGQCLAYDDLFNGGYELRAIGDLDGEIQANQVPFIAGKMIEGTWYHIALTWDYASSSIDLQVYVDGDNRDAHFVSAGTDPSISGDVPMILGAAAIDSLAAGGAVSIAAPKSFSEEIDGDQILAEYTRGVPEENHAGLISEYSSRPEDGDFAHDLISGLKLTIAGTPTQTLVRGWTEAGAALRFGAGVTGVESAFRKDHPFMLSDDHTFEAWLRIEGGSNQVIWTNEGAAGYEQDLRYNATTGKLDYRCVVGATERTVSAPIGTDRLTHVVVTRVYAGGNTTQNIYLDGVLTITGTNAGAPVTSSSYAYIYFGADSSADYFFGMIQGIRLYDEALDASEVLALHTAGQAIIESGAWATQTITPTTETTPITGFAYCEETDVGDGNADIFDVAYPVVLYKRDASDNFRALFVGSADSVWSQSWETIDALVDSCYEIRFMCKDVTHTRPSLYGGEPGIVHFDILSGGEESPESIIASVDIPAEKRQILEKIVMRCKPLHTWAGMVVRYT